MNRIKYVAASFAPTGKYVKVKVPAGTEKGWFGSEKPTYRKEKQFKQTGVSDSQVDGPKLAEEINVEVQALNEQGFEVIGITPITSGRYHWQRTSTQSSGWGYGYGYGYTEGVVILARKTEPLLT